jgi:hypothetical protein
LEKEYEILESFDTSMGLIVSIHFFSKEKPELGKKINYKEIIYVVSGVILHSSPYQANIALINRMEEGIYDCFLKPL